MTEDIYIKGCCPICENKTQINEPICSFCGYDFKKELIDEITLKNYVANIKSSKDWVKEIVVKKNFNNLKIKTHGFASTNPERGGWSITKTGEFFNETKGTTSTDIKLVETIIANPILKSCRNKTEAKKRAQELNSSTINKVNLFESEASLQDYLSKNWEEFPFIEDWKIYNRSISKGKFNTGEIGEMDFLAKHKTKPRWLIIELKKDQSSDATVGQTLRYMGWVKENLAEQNETVEGLIIAGSEDDRIQYALICLQSVTLKIYQMINNKLILNDPKPIGILSSIEKLSDGEKAKLLKKLMDHKE